MHKTLLQHSQVTEALFGAPSNGLLTRRDGGDLDLSRFSAFKTDPMPIILMGVQNRAWNLIRIFHFSGSEGCWEIT